MRRALAALALVALVGCTPAETRAWLRWHRADPEAAQAWLASPDGQAKLNEPATATEPAVRLEGDPWPDVPDTPSDETWDRIAFCESGGDWSINTGNGYYGGVQFGLTGWRHVGGTGLPSDASRDEQIYRADKLWLIQGWPAWPGCSRKLGLR